MECFREEANLTRHQSTGRPCSSRVFAAIAFHLALVVIAAATLSFAQATDKAGSVLMCSDPSAAAVPAASGLTANVDTQPTHNPAGDLLNELAVPFGPNEVQNKVRRPYVSISIEKSLGIHKGGGLSAALLPRQGRKVALAIGNNVSVGPTISSPLVTVMPNSQQGNANPCNAPSTNTVSTSLLSVVDTAPYILPFFNNGPVFGLPGTIEGDFWHRTQLIGDPNCKRTELTSRGVFIDLYSTSAYERVTSGGLKTGNSYFQNTQLSINLDTGRAGLWPGGLFHFTVQSRYGSSPENSFTAGSFAPEYAGLELPGPLFWQDTLPSEYFLMQAVSKKFNVILGKINGFFIADQTLFGDRFRYYFANFNFNQNPIYGNFFNTTTLSAIGLWTTTPWLTIAAGVHDPHTEPNTLAANAFQNGDVNLYQEAIFTYTAGGRPAQIAPSFNWSNAPKIDLESPFGQLSPAQIPQAVEVLLGSDSTAGLPINFRKRSFFAISNFSQYLSVKEEDPSQIAEKLKNGQPLRGVGVFGRLGYAGPQASNTINQDASVALLARGLLSSRQYDSFGIGFYYNGVSEKFKNSIRQLTGTTVKNENGIEIFYDFAITPAINVNAGYQHIWNPLTASVTVNQDHADLFLVRLNVVW
jgi:porin